MDRVFSSRISDKTVRKINDLARRMRTSKKSILEQAVELLGSKVECQPQADVFEVTNGAWKRKESPASTVAKIRKSFRESMNRRSR